VSSDTTTSTPSPQPPHNSAASDGAFALKGMILLDEIRGRLAEVFSLKTYKIDHVVHGAIGPPRPSAR
jgi:hypothetical protein